MKPVAFTSMRPTEFRTLSTGDVKPYRTTQEHRLIVKLRRDELRAQGKCINSARHPKPRKGVRCESCAKKHRGEA